MIERASPNFDERPGGVDMLVLHYTGMLTGAAAIERLCDPRAKVSAHYVVEEDGAVWRLVEEGRRAWHAGVSYWRGRRDLNDVSVGVEIVNPGHEFGYRAFPEAQIAAVMELCRGVLARHAIPAAHVVGHSDVAPFRKQDPGELFPWARLAEAGIGLWPGGVDAGGGDGGWDAARVRAALGEIGYDVSAPGDDALAVVVRAFQRHWRPEAVTGVADAGTILRLEHLLRMVPGNG